MPPENDKQTQDTEGANGALEEARRLVRPVLWAALIAAGAWLSLPLLTVPVTLQSFFALLAGLGEGSKRGAQAAGLYLLAGLLGLPIFAGGLGGPAILWGPTAGFALAFPLVAAVAGLAVRGGRRPGAGRIFLWALAATVLLYFCGWLGLRVNAGLGPGAAAAVISPFIPGDVIKCAAAAALAVSPFFRRLFPSPGGPL